MPDTAGLLSEGARAVNESGVGRSRFGQLTGTGSEHEYKRRCAQDGTVMYHAHIGLATWPATKVALAHVTGSLESAGYRLDRFGLCLEHAMGLPAGYRASMQKETGPRLEEGDWPDIAAVSAQPHLGDFMIGTPASLENTVHALRAGITTLGNLAQYFAFDVPGGWDEHRLRDATVRALGAMAAARDRGALVHSYLDDGPAMRLSSYGNYLAWAALEKYIVEDLAGARIAHCFGGLVPQPPARAFIALTLRELHGTQSPGSMIYGNTVDYTRDTTHNRAVLDTYLLVDIATQVHAPTGHALNPVPLTENIRIPSADEVLEVHLAAREIEREARRAVDLFDWVRFEREAEAAAAYARSAASRMLGCLAEDGTDPEDAGSLLYALRHVDTAQLERRLDMQPPAGFARLEPWKAGTISSLTERVQAAATPRRLEHVRVVVGGLDVHDLARDVLFAVLPRLGAEVVALPRACTPEAVANAAIAEDADAVVVSTYNGAALTLGRRLATALADNGFDGVAVLGGVLNEDDGGDLPVDVRDQLLGLGFHCPADMTEVPAAIAANSQMGRRRAHRGSRRPAAAG